MLKKWLKAGYMERSVLQVTEEGTPQGGIISPAIANMALDGLSQRLLERFPRSKLGNSPKVNLARYADDFIVTGASKELLEQEVKPFIEAFFKKLWWWARRRHPRKSATWVKQKYFTTDGTYNWVFTGEVNDEEGHRKIVHLRRASDVKIQRHTPIQGEANPFDPAWELYFERRLGVKMAQNLTGKRQLRYLWKQQNGICPLCQQKITQITGWHNHHIIWKSKGGTHHAANRVLLHPTCHMQLHSHGLYVEKPCPSDQEGH
jgi:hypothetical protein